MNYGCELLIVCKRQTYDTMCNADLFNGYGYGPTEMSMMVPTYFKHTHALTR